MPIASGQRQRIWRQLGRAGLPTPGGFALTADAYRHQIAALGLEDAVREYGAADLGRSRRLSIAIRLGLYQAPIAPEISEPLMAAWRTLREGGAPVAVRSSALVEDRAGANFAGQFESFLGLESEADVLTAVRACWAALWTTNARRYMDSYGLNPADTAMAVLIQPLVAARASGGGLSKTAEGQMLLSATWGLGSAIAQGEVVPDRIVLTRQGFVREIEAGRKDHRDTCGHGTAAPQKVEADLVAKPCLDHGQATTLGRMLLRAERVIGGPAEIEWALDDNGFTLLQARPLQVQPTRRAGRNLAAASQAQRPSGGHRLGRGACGGGQLRMRTFPRRAGRCAGDAGCRPGAEPHPAAGGRRRCRARRLDLASCLACARARHTDGARRARCDAADSRRRPGRRRWGCRHRAVDFVKRPRVFVTQPIAASALKRLRAMARVTVNEDSSRIIAKRALIAATRNCDILFPRLHDTVDRAVVTANPKLTAICSMTITPDRTDVATATARGIIVTTCPPIVHEATADINFGLMLAVARNMVVGDQYVRAGKFPGSQSNHLAGSWVYGKTIGLIGGGGRIGKAVARRAHGFSMRVLYWTPRRKPEAEEHEAGLTYVALDELLEESDFVSLHSPLKPESVHQIGARELRLMKKSAFIINTARGPIIDEAALIHALQRGQIAGAGIDTFEFEPKVSPALRKLPNVVLTPHLGSAVAELREQMAHVVVNNIEAVIEGRRPPNIINPQVLSP